MQDGDLEGRGGGRAPLLQASPTCVRSLPTKAFKLLDARLDVCEEQALCMLSGVQLLEHECAKPGHTWAAFNCITDYAFRLCNDSHELPSVGKACKTLGAAGGIARPGKCPRDERPLSAKALRVLGVTYDDVRMEKACRVLGELPWARREIPTRWRGGWQHAFTGVVLPSLWRAESGVQEGRAPLQPLYRMPKQQQLLGEAASSVGAVRPRDRRSFSSKALQVLGATIDDVRMEKAYRVLGEVPWAEPPQNLPAGGIMRCAQSGLS
eukprot:CAMPEP_0119379012 /NCGR_PEP_ID=MMETSP1334-20130426/50988_1 /TAXON_ID=127549 /ORGANISM="Calcidiscus leptoporus, Strain RCC1130" /LENGTH=265 /DNA_ID=CAMNT_0007398399 /DNA_START=88 /DNA_END=885 /DNA_ORIENTATION=-